MSVCTMWCTEDEMQFLFNLICTSYFFTVLCLRRVDDLTLKKNRWARWEERMKECVDAWKDGCKMIWRGGGWWWGLDAILDLLLWESKCYISWFRKVIPRIVLATFGLQTLPWRRVFGGPAGSHRKTIGSGIWLDSRRSLKLIGWSSDTPTILVDDG